MLQMKVVRYNTDLLHSLITKQIVVVFQIKKTPCTFVSQ